MATRVERPSVREGYDRWARSYDDAPNPVVALDRRHSLSALRPQSGEWILDAGCGTGSQLGALRRSGSEPVGMDFSRGMLEVARQRLGRARLVQGDLDRPFPLEPKRFDAVLSSLVSEHLRDLRSFFSESFGVLKSGGRFVFSAFHPEPARAGVEANFQEADTEFRLGAEPYTVADYLGRIWDAGFRDLRCSEHAPDPALLASLPEARKYAGQSLLLLVSALRP